MKHELKSIQLKNVSFSYQSERPIFKNITVEVRGNSEGRIYAVTGESGVGKTTLLRLIAALEKPIQGKLVRSGGRLGYLSQKPVLFEHLSRKQNALYLAQNIPTAPKVDDMEFRSLADHLGLSEIVFSKRSVAEMSGGEQQRLALLRALLACPDVLLLDEPCSGLDPAVKQEFLIMLLQQVRERGMIVIYVTHHFEEVALIADSVVFIEHVSKNRNDKQIHVLPFDKCLRLPPMLDMVQFMSREPLNVIQCSVSNKGIMITESGNPIAQFKHSIKPQEKCFAVFSPAPVQRTNSIGLIVRTVRRAGNYYIVEIAQDTSLNGGLLSDCQNFTTGSKVGINGLVWLYGADRGAIEAVECIPVGN